MVPPPVRFAPSANPTLFPLAEREIRALAEAVHAAADYAKLLMHMLNRREAADSSQIEGTHTEFGGLLLHELEAGTPEDLADRDAEQTLNYVRAYATGLKRVEAAGRHALDPDLIKALHRCWMAGDTRTSPGQFRSTRCADET